MVAVLQPLLQPAQKRLQWLHQLQSARAGITPAGLTAHIQAQGVKAQGRTIRQLQQLALGIHTGDLGLEKGHARTAAQIPEINRAGFARVEAGHQARHHAGIERGTGAIHQEHRHRFRLQPRPHDPAAQQQGMGVAATGKHQQGSSRWLPLRRAQGSVHVQLTVVIPAEQ